MLKYGCDFSGICSAAQALHRLKVKFKHVYSAENDKFAVASLLANYKPERLFGDITMRNIDDVPYVDLYCASPPCQSFSSAKRNATRSSDLCKYSLEVIKTKRPKCFIIENVVRFAKADVGQVFLNKLKSLPGYKIFSRILNTKNHGLPQSRSRFYIVGTRVGRFEWPPYIKHKPLRTYVDFTDTSRFKSKSMTKRFRSLLPKRSVFVDFNFRHCSTFPNSDVVCPCIMASSGLWNVPMHRFANSTEWLTLQGFPKTFKQVVSNWQLRRQIGNSVSVDVLVHILKELLANGLRP